ncbi:MBL fold metallo-hydrolase [Danxiaibacter flavus]|uniref:MBL fold metallo-hydrolase n=1 Tax=Danxiaibacter flavus TaxID=3049108 RepID=A0ABV3ZNS0_9BACT|nr:MBL fold metallo-hydrolase [Chitinophagaceae bacterium DXS]
MKLKIIGSSSAGNCYILENDKEALIIEAGVRFEKIKKALNFQLSKVAGCLLTHEHGDHAKGVNEVMAAGIDVYSAPGTFEVLKINNHRAKKLTVGQVFSVGSFKVIAFDVNHDVRQPVGFIINHEETGNVLFLTDTYYVSNKFKNIHNILIEANYCLDIIRRKVDEGRLKDFLKDRVIQSHMSIDTCRNTLLANDLSKVNNIVLIHLSDSNSNAAEFQQKISRATGKTVHIADAGIVIENFNKTPF